MKTKLNVAIIGQGRSGRNIHGEYFKSERNEHFTVKYVVELDPERRERAEKEYPGCRALADYRELYDIDDVDLVVNATYSDTHYSISRDLLLHGKNVLCEKPFGRTQYECEDLMRIAESKGVVLAAFQNTQPAPFYLHALELIKNGTLGDVKQINIRYNAFARRWDWQTLQKKLAGSAYNTGPHPVAMGLGFLDFDKHSKLVYSRLDTAVTSGDGDDYVKMLITAPGKPLVDIEMISIDAFTDYNLMVMGTKGTLRSTPKNYKLKYIVDGENEQRPVIEESLKDENGLPAYCKDNLKWHSEEGSYDGTAFEVGTHAIYEGVYGAITEGKPLTVPNEHAAMTISMIEAAHANNPLPVKFI